MILHTLVLNVIALFIYMTLWFVVARLTKKISVVDVAWGSGFVIVAWIAATAHHSSRSTLIAILVTLWAIRITSHLARRVFGRAEDPRYKAISNKWEGNFWLRAYYSIFLFQGLMVLIITLPVIAATGEQNADLAALSVLGAALWAIGFCMEAAADRQLRIFVSEPSNKGQVMDQGLWRYSRHPNYFGELTQWWAIAIIALQVKGGWYGLLGPLTLTILILFVSGIPPTERRKKGDPLYADYMKRTSMIVPWFPKRSQ